MKKTFKAADQTTEQLPAAASYLTQLADDKRKRDANRERRSARLNILTTPTMRDAIIKTAEAQRINLNELINRLMRQEIDDKKDLVARYEAFFEEENKQ